MIHRVREELGLQAHGAALRVENPTLAGGVQVIGGVELT